MYFWAATALALLGSQSVGVAESEAKPVSLINFPL